MATHADTENFDWEDATEPSPVPQDTPVPDDMFADQDGDDTDTEAAADKTSDLTAAMHFAQVENDARRSRKRIVISALAAIVVIAAVAFGVHLLMPRTSVSKSREAGSAATRAVEPAEGSEADETTAADPVNLVAEGEEEGANASASGVRLSNVGGNALPAPSGSRSVTTYVEVAQDQAAEGSDAATDEDTAETPADGSGTDGSVADDDSAADGDATDADGGSNSDSGSDTTDGETGGETGGDTGDAGTGDTGTTPPTEGDATTEQPSTETE